MLPSICPYDLKPLVPRRLSIEHVIPDALGGPKAFSVDADAKLNSQFGSGLDAAFVNGDMLKAAATHFGIKTRSGPAKLRVRGELSFGQNVIPAIVEHGGTGRPTIHPIVPVKRVAEGFELIDDKATFDKLVEKTLTNNAAKGVALQQANLQSPLAQFAGRMEYSQWAKTKGLLKIGYLTLAYSFGDVFLLSPAGQAFRDGINSTNERDLDQSGLSNQQAIFKKSTLKPSAHHRVAAVRCGQRYVAYVSVFRTDIFTRQFSFPSTPTNFLPDSGYVYYVDARRRTFTHKPFDASSHL